MSGDVSKRFGGVTVSGAGIDGARRSRSRKRPSSTNYYLFWTFLILVLACCMINLKLHSDAVIGSNRYHRWSEYGGDPIIVHDNDDYESNSSIEDDDDDDYMNINYASARGGQHWFESKSNDSGSGTNAPTVSPTTAKTGRSWTPTSSTTSWSPAMNQQQQSWAPTYDHTTMATNEQRGYR